MKFVDELRWRGMLHDIMPGTEELLNSGQTKGYIGFDPTSDSLGVGNLVQIMTLLHFQRAGHQPYVLVGGATGMVGDPSGKSQERNLLSAEQLHFNIEGQKKQLMKFLDFSTSLNPAVMVNNYDWFKDFSFLDFIREVGKHISVNYMMAKDSVQNRLSTGMSFTEFSYQLVQGYDFYYLWKNHGVSLQMGGSDQWGNIVTGTELIRRKAAGEAFAITTPLIKKSDGSKFGKTESGNVWLDPARTSPYHFYQFWLNAADQDAAVYIRIFSLKSKEEIEALEIEHAAAPHLRKLQMELAREVTERVHGTSELNAALEASEILFGKGTEESLKRISEKDFIQIFDGVPAFKLSRSLIESGIPLADLLAVHTTILPSKGEAKKMSASGAISINKTKIEDYQCLISSSFLLNNRYILVQKGKKNYYLIIAE
jgi:tyrosyl-tRNA synthetase